MQDEKINRGDYLGAHRDDESIPVLNQQNPSWGNRLTKWLATAVVSLFGWRLAGRIPDAPKVVVIGAPHTSNWDWVLVMLAALALGIRVSWLAKHTAFKPPIGGIMRALGGIPVDRRSPKGLVGQMVDRIRETDKVALCITPEGTRSKVNEWKKGFHHIASQANVPLVLASFDYGRKVVGFGPTLALGDSVEEDLAKIQTLYKDVQAKNPINY